MPREDSLLLLLLLLLFHLVLRSTFILVNSPSGPVYNQLLSSTSHRHFNLINLTKATLADSRPERENDFSRQRSRNLRKKIPNLDSSYKVISLD